jgi:uncharacterized protein (TIGR02246 family)
MCYGLAQSPVPVWAQAPRQDEVALRQRAEAFVAAFNTGDAKALAAFWTPDGDYIDQTGLSFKGREAIEGAYQGLFAAHQGLKLGVMATSVRIVTSDLVIEDGTTEVMPADGGPPSRARYTVVHVKCDGQWRIASVREAPFVPPSHYEYLRELEWLIGDWSNAGETAEAAYLSFTWADHQNFIAASLMTTLQDMSVSRATQWIGWDPVAKQIRSWSFELSGGFGEGSWTKEGNRWIIKTTTTLRDRRRVRATSIMGPVDEDTPAWQAKDRTVDGISFPETQEGRMKRLK